MAPKNRREAGVPPLPDSYAGNGYDWLQELEGGWRPVPAWGRDGWDLGIWPLVAVAHYDGDDSFGVATRIEGDVELEVFPTREERDAATDQIAAYWWRDMARNDLPSHPRDLPHHDDDLLPHQRGPFSRERLEREKGVAR